MGRSFGDLAFIRGIITYTLSSHEQKPFAGALTYGLPNLVPRTLATLWTYLPNFILGYLIYSGVENAYKLSKRKNPKDYIDEVDPNINTAKDEAKDVCRPRKPKPKT